MHQTLLLAALVAAPVPAHAFLNVSLGEVIPNPEMQVLDGGRQRLLSRARVTVFVFFRPQQDHSLQVLGQLAELEKELSGRDLRFAAVTSDSYDRAAVRATAAEAGIGMPVLLDAGDELYGTLGVAMHPVVGFAGPDGRLLDYQHFLKVNMRDAVRARIQKALGEIGPEELARALDPPRAGTDDATSRAKRRVKLAKMLFERGNVDRAEESARLAIEADPRLAEAHLVLAQLLAHQGRCQQAGEAHDEARRLDAALPAAPPRCKGR